MEKSHFGICIQECQAYFERDINDQQLLLQGALVQICEEDNSGVSTIKVFHVNYSTRALSLIDKNYLIEKKNVQKVHLKLFRFLISVQSASERSQLLVKADVLCNLRNRKQILLDKQFLKYFENIICQLIYIGEVPELGVGDFIGIKLMNCSLPLIMVGSQKDFARKYIGDLQDSLIISALEFTKFYIKEILQAAGNVVVKPQQSGPKAYICSKCKASDHIIHFRACPHKMCKDCLIEKFKLGQNLEITCGYRLLQDHPCPKIINLEHFKFLYPELSDIFNEIKIKLRKFCYKCLTKEIDNTGNVLQLSDCLHSMCKSCALDSLTLEPKGYCRFLMDNGDECKAAIQEKYLKKLMSPEDLAAYEERKFVHILESTPNSRRCKTLNCKYFWIVDVNTPYTSYYCKLCKNNNCLKCNAVHNVSCKEYERQILDGSDEVKKNELLDRLSKEEIADHDLVRQGKVEKYSEAEKFRLLRTKYINYDEMDLLWAIRQSDEMSIIEKSLNIECNFCGEIFSHNNIFGMITCEHTFCMNCAKTYFTIQITEKTIRDCICPACKLPKLDDDSSESEYFGLIGAYLKNILEAKTYEIFDRKTRDRALSRLQNFAWCVKCVNGFEVNPNRANATCTECKSVFCIKCYEPWQAQHEGISCELFKNWKDENDPKNQSEGVMNYLEKNGIECPAPTCKFKYSLAKGGCLHFTCTQCSYQFCFGCRQPMLAGAKCTKYNDCATRGLHAHHPRNCLFFLRDCAVASLEGLLKSAGINFTGIPQNGAICQIPIQKEMPGKMIDCLCEKPTVNESIGLCEQHYKEGLVDLIFKSKIDPVDILDLGESVGELTRNHVALPARLATDTDATYRDKCVAEIKQQIPFA